MKELKAGTFYDGKDVANLIDNTLGFCDKNLDYNSVDLTKFGQEGIIAWFVYLDGHEHGPTKFYKIKTHLHEKGALLHEHMICKKKKILFYYRKRDGCLPVRLVFQIDPFKDGSLGKGKFYGVYVFSKFINEKLTRMEYKKVSNDFTLGDFNVKEEGLLNLYDFCEYIPNYFYPVSEMKYSKGILKFLNNNNIKYAGQLLFLKTQTTDRILNKIQKCYFDVFGRIDDYINNEKVEEVLTERISLIDSNLRINKISDTRYEIFNEGTKEQIDICIDPQNGLMKFGNQNTNKCHKIYFNNQNIRIFTYFVDQVIKHFNDFC